MLARVKLVEVEIKPKQKKFTRVNGGKEVVAHFNPETLKVNYANENRGGKQPSGGGGQFIGSSTSKMSVELLFDNSETNQDVRRITEEVLYFMKPGKKTGGKKKSNRIPPMISFEWGTFIFRGVVNSIDETLEYFSEEGVPLRATLALNISKQDLQIDFGKPGKSEEQPAEPNGTQPAPGTQPLTPPRAGDSVQQMAAREGRSNDWKAIATANGIDNPLRLSTGSLINMNVASSLTGSISAGAGANLSASLSGGFSGSANLSGGGQAGFSAGLGAGTGFSAGASASANAGLGGSAGAAFGASGAATLQAGLTGSAGVNSGFSGGLQTGGSFRAGGSAASASVRRTVNLLDE